MLGADGGFADGLPGVGRVRGRAVDPSGLVPHSRSAQRDRALFRGAPQESFRGRHIERTGEEEALDERAALSGVHDRRPLTARAPDVGTEGVHLGDPNHEFADSFQAQLRTRTGDPFLTMVDWPISAKAKTAC